MALSHLKAQMMPHCQQVQSKSLDEIPSGHSSPVTFSHSNHSGSLENADCSHASCMFAYVAAPSLSSASEA